jgi:RNA polymerase sigma factor (TIGR02999 family)
MSDVTQILSRIEAGDPQASADLLPLVYGELRKLAAAKMAQEQPGQTLQATALVHEAYVRLVDSEKVKQWNSRGHFFGAAAEAMRRILVDCARHKLSLKRGGQMDRVDLAHGSFTSRPEQLLAVDEALGKLAAEDAEAAELIKLRYYGGFSVVEAAELIGLSKTTAYGHWAFAKAWLRREVGDE